MPKTVKRVLRSGNMHRIGVGRTQTRRQGKRSSRKPKIELGSNAFGLEPKASQLRNDILSRLANSIDCARTTWIQLAYLHDRLRRSNKW